VCTEACSICGESYDENYCKNIIKYLQTDFCRILVSFINSTHNGGKKAYKLIPMQNFTNESDIDWNNTVENIDIQLFKKYKLTDNEVEYIREKCKVKVINKW
jgi:hypothetical protein